MRLRGHDQAFVGVPPARVYGVLADPGGYARWWPGAEAGDADGDLRLPLGRGRTRGRAEGRREGVGLWVALPDFDGSLEWFLEAFDDGAIVNALLDVELPGGPRRAGRRLRGLRISLRRALVGLKRDLEGGS